MVVTLPYDLGAMSEMSLELHCVGRTIAIGYIVEESGNFHVQKKMGAG